MSGRQAGDRQPPVAFAESLCTDHAPHFRSVGLSHSLNRRRQSVSNDESAACRGIRALCAAEGQFAVLLDESFTILWHTPTLTDILGYPDLVGHDGTEHLHPDDVGLVGEMLAQFYDQQTGPAVVGPAFRPDPADIRLRSASGGWIAVETAAHDLTQHPAVRGFLVTFRLIVDRTDVGRAIELLGTGAAVTKVLPLIARLGDNVMGTNTPCLIAWRDDDDDHIDVAWSPDAPAPHDDMMEAARTALRDLLAAAASGDKLEPIAQDAAEAARLAGCSMVNILPIVAPGTSEVVGAMIAWGNQRRTLSGHPQLPLQNGLRLAALAIIDGRIKGVLQWSATRDPLTSLINRSEFARRLSELDNDDIALLYVDLDDFKPVNDTHGHPVGDAVLIEIANRISRTVGDSGFAGRLGGDEFAVVITGVRDVEQGWTIADQLVTIIQQPIRIDHLVVSVGASVGVALGVQPLIPRILIARADDALLAAKQAGKSTIKFAR